MNFDPESEPTPPRTASSVLLFRETELEVEFFFVKRTSRSSFMANWYVFPGGAVGENESVKEACIRELFEEAGVLLAGHDLTDGARDEWRTRLNSNQDTWDSFKLNANVVPQLDHLFYWSNWITPSAEPKRFNAEFFLAELPVYQEARCDGSEVVAELWATAEQALAKHHAKEIVLPPPQLVMMTEIARLPARNKEALLSSIARREATRCAILPRFRLVDNVPHLFFPWSGEYEMLGRGESISLPDDFPYLIKEGTVALREGTWFLK